MPTTLTAHVLMDMDDIRFVVYSNDALGDGAIGSVEVTAYTHDVLAFAIYRGTTVSQWVAAGTTWSRTFAGNSAKAGDVTAIGFGVMP